MQLVFHFRNLVSGNRMSKKRDDKHDKRGDKQDHKMDKAGAKEGKILAKAELSRAKAAKRRALLYLILAGLGAWFLLKGGSGSGIIESLKSKIGM